MGVLEDALEVTDGNTDGGNSGGEAGQDTGGGAGSDDSGTAGADDSSSGDDAGVGDTGNSKGAGEGDDTSNANGAGDDPSAGDASTGDNAIAAELEKLKSNQEEMQQMLRVTRRENATLRAKVGRIKDNVDLDTDLDEGEGGEGVKLTQIETLQNALTDIGNSRGPQLELMVEQMAEMNKYSDVMDVCSKANVDTIVETAAGLIQDKEGGDLDEIMLGLEVNIWSQPNPYKYLYGIVKANHPKYANADTSGKEDSKSKVDKALEDKAASSIQDMGGSGGSKGGGGWTADKIDRLPENELNQVPGDIYEKYLQGILK